MKRRCGRITSVSDLDRRMSHRLFTARMEMKPLSRALFFFPGLAPGFFGTVPSDVSAEYTDLHKAPDVISLIPFCLTTPAHTQLSVIVITRPRAWEEGQDLTRRVNLINAVHFCHFDLGEIVFFVSLKHSLTISRASGFFYYRYTANYQSVILTFSLLKSHFITRGNPQMSGVRAKRKGNHAGRLSHPRAPIPGSFFPRMKRAKLEAARWQRDGEESVGGV